MSAPQPPALDPVAEASDEFSRVFGRALISWATIEQHLFFWFLYITKMDVRIGRAIYYSFSGFDGRANMLTNVLPVAKITDAERALLVAIVNKAKKFAQFRNALAHGQPSIDISVDLDPPVQFRFMNGKHEFPQSVDEAVSVEKVLFATNLFNTLTDILVRSSINRGEHNSARLEGFRRIVGELPNPQHWDQTIQNEKARLHQQPPSQP